LGHLRQLHPILRTRFQSPEVFWSIQLCRQHPALLTRADRLAVHDMSYRFAPSLSLKVHWNAGFQPHGRPNRATMRADNQGLAHFGKIRAWLQAGNEKWNRNWQPRATPRWVDHICIVHRHPSFGRARAGSIHLLSRPPHH